MRLHRAIAIVLTLILVLAVGTLLVILMFNTIYDFIANVGRRPHTWCTATPCTFHAVRC